LAFAAATGSLESAWALAAEDCDDVEPAVLFVSLPPLLLQEVSTVATTTSAAAATA
jgi:hypothetical protein